MKLIRPTLLLLVPLMAYCGRKPDDAPSSTPSGSPAGQGSGGTTTNEGGVVTTSSSGSNSTPTVKVDPLAKFAGHVATTVPVNLPPAEAKVPFTYLRDFSVYGQTQDNSGAADLRMVAKYLTTNDLDEVSIGQAMRSNDVGWGFGSIVNQKLGVSPKAVAWGMNQYIDAVLKTKSSFKSYISPQSTRAVIQAKIQAGIPLIAVLQLVPSGFGQYVVVIGYNDSSYLVADSDYNGTGIGALKSIPRATFESRLGFATMFSALEDQILQLLLTPQGMIPNTLLTVDRTAP